MEINKLVLPDMTMIWEKEKIVNDSLITAKDDELYIETEKLVKKDVRFLIEKLDILLEFFYYHR